MADFRRSVVFAASNYPLLEREGDKAMKAGSHDYAAMMFYEALSYARMARENPETKAKSISRLSMKFTFCSDRTTGSEEALKEARRDAYNIVEKNQLQLRSQHVDPKPEASRMLDMMGIRRAAGESEEAIAYVHFESPEVIRNVVSRTSNPVEVVVMNGGVNPDGTVLKIENADNALREIINTMNRNGITYLAIPEANRQDVSSLAGFLGKRMQDIVFIPISNVHELPGSESL